MAQIQLVKEGGLKKLEIFSAENFLCDVHLYEVGRGSFGTVLRAWHSNLGDVAVKCFTITGGERQQSSLQKKILKEYNKLQECRHENVVNVFGVTKWTGAMGILMQYCEGGNLRDFLLDRSIDVGLVLLLRMNLDIAAGVAHLHNCGLDVRVIHGDLKPENILLTIMLVCKISDFGSAQLGSYTGSTTIEAGKEKIALTLYYAAPEKLLHGARPKKEQDAYSCGVIQHMTLSREEPYQSQIEFQTKLNQALRPNCEAIQELKEESRGNNREIVEVIEGAMVRCWDQDPTKRPNMITIRDEFQALMAKQAPAIIPQQVAVAVRGMNIQHPPQNPIVPLESFSTQHRSFWPMRGFISPVTPAPNTQPPVPSPFQGALPVDSNDVTNPKRFGGAQSVDLTDVTTPKHVVDADLENMAPPVTPANAVTPVNAVTPANAMTNEQPHESTQNQGAFPVGSSVVTSPKVVLGAFATHSSDVTSPKVAFDAAVHNTPPIVDAVANTQQELQQNQGESSVKIPHGTGFPPTPSGIDEDSSGFLVIGGEGSERSCVKWNVTTKECQHLPELLAQRKSSSSARVKGTVYVMGGMSKSGGTKSCEKMDLHAGSRWTAIGDMLETCHSAPSTVIQDKIYLAGGWGGSRILSSCMAYDVNVDSWTKCFEMMQARWSHGICSIDSSIYCIGGDHCNDSLEVCERYDIRTKVPSEIASLSEPRSDFACAQVGGKIYVIGGWGDDVLDTVEEYEPRMNKWKFVRPLPAPRFNLTACVVNDRIYIVGGRAWHDRKLDAFKSVEAYDPASNEWSHCLDLEESVYATTVVAV